MKNIVLEYCKAHVLLQMLDLHRERGSLCSQLHAWPFFSVMVGMMTNNDNNDKNNHDCGNDYKYDNITVNIIDLQCHKNYQ